MLRIDGVHEDETLAEFMVYVLRAVCTGTGFENHFSEVATLANKELDLPEENLVEVVRHGLSLPNPFA